MTSAKAVVDTVGGVGAIIKTVGNAVGDHGMARFGEVLESKASQVNSGIDSFAAQVFDTSSGSYGYGRSIGDAVQVASVIVGVGAIVKGTVKAAATVAKMSGKGVRALAAVAEDVGKDAGAVERAAKTADEGATASAGSRIEAEAAGSKTVQTATNPLAEICQSPRELSPAPIRKELPTGPKRAELTTGAAESASKEASAGQVVFRVWGKDAANPELLDQQSGPWGHSWTRVDPRTVPNYRNAAGLPNDANLGRFLSRGVLHDSTGVTSREALRIGSNTGGLDEILVPNPESQITLTEVLGVNPEF